MPQSNVSRLEKGSDMLLSTLRSYVEAVGGKLNLTVELPNKPPISLAGLGDLMGNPKPEKVTAKFNDIVEALEFVSFGSVYEHQ